MVLSPRASREVSTIDDDQPDQGVNTHKIRRKLIQAQKNEKQGGQTQKKKEEKRNKLTKKQFSDETEEVK